MEWLIQVGFFAVLLAVGLIFGSRNEKRHYRRIEEQEALLRGILVFNERHLPPDMSIARGNLVVGSVVIGEDYFKRIAAALKGFFGGRLTVYESLMDRGRREAVIRMKEEARRLGATMVFNVRFETSSLSEDTSGRRAAFSAEFIAYGTALIPTP
ncbi:MAG: YbjQ family protein [Candidatus Binatia bacterium]